MSLSVGSNLGPYEVLGLLGERRDVREARSEVAVRNAELVRRIEVPHRGRDRGVGTPQRRRDDRLVEMTLAEVREADAGYWFSPDGTTYPFRSTGVVVPTLEDLLTRWDNVFLNIDAKSDETVAPLVALYSAIGPKLLATKR